MQRRRTNGDSSGCRAASTSIDADLVLIAMGFAGVEDEPTPPRSWRSRGAGRSRNGRGSLRGVAGVFAAGDARRGASLIVWAIREGRDAAVQINRDLRRSAA